MPILAIPRALTSRGPISRVIHCSVVTATMMLAAGGANAAHAISPQPQPNLSRATVLSLPPGFAERFGAVMINPQPQPVRRFDQITISPHPLPGRLLDRVALNPQPLPPRVDLQATA